MSLPSPARRELTEIDVEYISLVSRPANGRPLVLKDAGGLLPRLFSLKAGPDELRRAYGIVYPVGDTDTEGDTASAATVLRAADRWMRAGRAHQVDRQHSFAAEMAYVAESWIVRAGDALFSDETPGAWAVGIQIGDPGLWEQLKAGKLAGLSLAGMVETGDPADVAEPDDDDAAKNAVVKGWLSKVYDRLTKGDSDMTPAEVQKLIDDSVPKIVEAALKAAKADQQGQTDTSPAKPTEGVSKADVAGAVAEAVAALKSDLTAVVKAELTTALTKGAAESDSAGLLPMGERETGGLL